MSRVEKIEQEITSLDEAELRALREWFTQYYATHWDRQIEADANSGKLADLAERAVDDHAMGRTTEL